MAPRELQRAEFALGKLQRARSVSLIVVETAAGDVEPAVNAHTDSVGSVVSTSALQEFRRTDVLNDGRGGAVGDTILIFIFKNQFD